MKLKHNFLILLFICVFQIVSAQSKEYRPGFIVDINQDTIKGLVKFKTGNSRFEYCTFKTLLLEEPVKYYPTQVLGYGVFHETYYKSKKVLANEQIGDYFAEILAKGRVSLLGVNGKFYLEDSEDIIYVLEIKNVNTSPYPSSKDLYKGILTWKLAGCDKVTSKNIQSVELNEQSLKKLFHTYNSCFQETVEEVPSVNSNKPKPDFRLGVIAGATFTSMHDLPVNYFFLTEGFKKNSSMTVGMTFILTLPESRFSINADILLQKATNEGKKVTGNMTETTYLEYSSLQIPLAISYFLTNSRAKFFLEGGFKGYFIINASNYYQRDFDMGSTIQTNVIEDLMAVQYTNVSPMVGCGVNYGINMKHRLLIKGRYDFGKAIIKDGKQETISIMAGFLFKMK